MRTSRRPAFTDPYLVHLCSTAEQLILSADELAAAEGIRLTDSGVKSALIRAANLMRGRPPKDSGHSPKDVFLAELTVNLATVWRTICCDVREGDETLRTVEITAAEWLAALSGIIQSVETRMTGEPGGRDYLAYLPEFLKHVPRAMRFKREDALEASRAGEPECEPASEPAAHRPG